jgi:hypothetical protein
MEGRVPIYFFNTAQGRVEAEFRLLAAEGLTEQIDMALRYFFSGPSGGGLSHVVPAGLEASEFLKDMYIADRMLVVSFSEWYSEMSPTDEIKFRSAFTRTMVSLPQIESVMFRAGSTESESGTEWGIERVESAETIANNPFISPARRTSEEFTLFFVCETGEGLITMQDFVPDVNLHTRIQNIVERLIEEQNAAGVMPLIPPETRVRLVINEPDAGLYIDFSGEFHSRFTGTTAQAELMLQSIAHSVLENLRENRTRVFFLIDSDRWEEFHGVSDFDLGFIIDESFMLGFIGYDEQEEAE